MGLEFKETDATNPVEADPVVQLSENRSRHLLELAQLSDSRQELSSALALDPPSAPLARLEEQVCWFRDQADRSAALAERHRQDLESLKLGLGVAREHAKSSSQRIATQLTELQSVRVELDVERQRSTWLARENSLLLERMAGAELELIRMEGCLESGNQAIAQLSFELSETKNGEIQIRRELGRCTSEIQDLIRQLQESEVLKANLLAETAKKKEVASRIAAESLEWQIRTEEAEERTRAAMTGAREFRIRCTRLEEEAEALRSELRAKEEKFAHLRTELEDSHHAIQTLSTREHQARLERDHSQQELERAHLDVQHSKARLQEADSALAGVGALCAQKDSELAASRLQSTEMAKNIADLRESLAAREISLAKANQIREGTETHRIRSESAKLRATEAKLKDLALHLETEKTEVRKFSKILTEELDSAMAVHPLQDYLEMTRFELSKLELQLKKTPFTHPERPKLETALTSLVEQRDFLDSLILNSRRQLLEHAAAVTRISNQLPPTGTRQ